LSHNAQKICWHHPLTLTPIVSLPYYISNDSAYVNTQEMSLHKIMHAIQVPMH